MTVENSKKLNGSIVLVRGTDFLARQIILHMKILAKEMKVPPLKYSHAEMLLWDDMEQQLYTIGARASGAEKSKVQDYYKDKEVLILSPIEPLSDADTLLGWLYWEETKDSKYQNGNFLAWILYIKTKLWVSKRGDEKIYCYEYAARYTDRFERWPRGQSLDRVSLYNLYYNQYYFENK